MRSETKAQVSKVSLKKKRKQDALDLALLIHDIYKEKVNDGQNNANQTDKEE